MNSATTPLGEASSTPAVLAIALRVNGVTHALQLEARVSLLDALRESLGLTGTKKGCNQGACGACTVLVDGERINSCLAFAVQYQGRDIVTIEGLAEAHGLHPLQQAFIKHDGFQCGYCTPGQICSAVGMLREFDAGLPSAVSAGMQGTPQLSDAEIKERMSGNLCRCGAYVGITHAIAEAAALARESPPPAALPRESLPRESLPPESPPPAALPREPVHG